MKDAVIARSRNNRGFLTRFTGTVRRGSVKNLGQPACLSQVDQYDQCLITRAAGVMQWTVRLEARTSVGEVTTTELVTF